MYVDGTSVALLACLGLRWAWCRLVLQALLKCSVLGSGLVGAVSVVAIARVAVVVEAGLSCWRSLVVVEGLQVQTLPF